jgi:hypothetical protein
MGCTLSNAEAYFYGARYHISENNGHANLANIRFSSGYLDSGLGTNRQDWKLMKKAEIMSKQHWSEQDNCEEHGGG